MKLKSTGILILLAFVGLFLSCTTDDTNIPFIEDKDGPEIYDVKWIDHPGIPNDPSGSVTDGGHYTISIKAGFQLNMHIRDASLIENGSVYILVNNDPALKETILSETTILGYREGSIGFVHRVNHITLGNGAVYDLKQGDRYHFYAEFSDEHGNKSSMIWTADLVD